MRPGEQAFLDWLLRRQDRSEALIVPLGDDAAVFREDPDYDVVVTADAIAEGSHFRKRDPPALIGRKALAVNLSDIAAMGAEPRLAVVTAALPRGFAPALPRALHRGIESLARAHGVLIAGGDTVTHAGGLVISVTLLGRVARGCAITRAGARPGDVIAVTGALGGSLRKGRHFTFEPRLREARDLVRFGPPTAMMDVSDGLLLDLWRLVRASRAGARIIADHVPVHPDAGRPGRASREHAFSDGEDFELLVTMGPETFARVRKRWRSKTPLTAIGEITRKGFTLVTNGVEQPVEPRGHEHR